MRIAGQIPPAGACLLRSTLKVSARFGHRLDMASKSNSNTSPITLSSLTYLQPTALAPLLLDPVEKTKIAIIDVRDSDHLGGNISGSLWVPVNQLDVRLPELLRTLKNKEKVVFHCMLSQVRGPKAALAYARARQRTEETKGEEKTRSTMQEVCVLEGGFGSWQPRYGDDPRLTADYQPDLWD
jgi:rhodanese-related sulfurtransferase